MHINKVELRSSGSLSNWAIYEYQTFWLPHVKGQLRLRPCGTMGLLRIAALAFTDWSVVTLFTGKDDSNCATRKDGEDCSATFSALPQAHTRFIIQQKVAVEAHTGANIAVHAECNIKRTICCMDGTTDSELGTMKRIRRREASRSMTGSHMKVASPFFVMHRDPGC